jgi:hypothetical protein
MITFIFEITCICAGLLLAVEHLDKIDGPSDFFVNLAKKLKPFNAIIGFATLIIGILFLLKVKCFVFSIVGILCGIALLPQRLSKIPGIGDNLLSFSNWLQPHKVILGDIALILGILGLFNINPFC